MRSAHGVIRALMCIAAALALARCDGGPAPTSPSSVSPAPAPAAPIFSSPTLTMTLTGTVTDSEGRPVSDATVKVNPFIPGVQSAQLTATTGPAGRYEFTFETAAGRQQGGGASASKPGYEDEFQYVVPAAHATQNFRLYPLTRVEAGTSRRVTLLPDDGFCGVSDEWRCRKFRVVSPVSGMLTLTVIPENANAQGYLEVFGPYQCCRSPLSVTVAANQELRVHVLMEWTSPVAQTFVFQTSLNSPREPPQ